MHNYSLLFQLVLSRLDPISRRAATFAGTTASLTSPSSGTMMRAGAGAGASRNGNYELLCRMFEFSVARRSRARE